MQVISWAALGRIAILLGVALAAIWAGMLFMCRCRGRTPPPATPPRIAPDRLRAHVETLADQIGPRSVFRPAQLRAAADYIRETWRAQDYEIHEQAYEVNGVTCANLEVSVMGDSPTAEILVIGAHYDTVDETPGANDNGSGVAALLELSRAFAGRGAAGVAPARTIRFVAFVNEEPPWFETEQQGSRVYAQACRERGDPIVGMIALETMGYFRDEPGSQLYPSVFRWFYPDRGNFIGFIGNLRSRAFLREAAAAFRGSTELPVECAATFASVPGVGWSDHASFWHAGYRAIMVTDTAPYRFPHYHTAGDTPEKIDYAKLAEVTRGLVGVIQVLAAGRPAP
jgi:hypothetical protein